MQNLLRDARKNRLPHSPARLSEWRQDGLRLLTALLDLAALYGPRKRRMANPAAALRDTARTRSEEGSPSDLPGLSDRDGYL